MPHHPSVHKCPQHRRPTEDELETLMTVLTAQSNIMLVPVRFNGEQRYAIAVAQGSSVVVLAVCPTELDSVVNVMGEGRTSAPAAEETAQRRHVGRAGL